MTYQEDLDLLNERAEAREEKSIQRAEANREDSFFCTNRNSGTDIFTCKIQCEKCELAEDKLLK